MSDAVWYYAEGDRQKGPVAAEELKRLVVLGRVKPTDLVWQPGMDDWVPAKAVRGLVPDELLDALPVSSDAPSIDAGFDDELLADRPLRRRRPRAGWNELLPNWNYQVLARGAALVGLLLIIGGRGGESFGAKLAKRQQVILEVAKSDLEADHRKRRLAIQTKLIAAQRADSGSPSDQQAIANFQQQIAQLDREYSERQNQLGQTTWLEMDIASRAAVSTHLAWQPWYEAYTVAGQVLLAVGLFVLGISGSSVERWGSFILLAVLLAATLWSRPINVL